MSTKVVFRRLVPNLVVGSGALIISIFLGTAVFVDGASAFNVLLALLAVPGLVFGVGTLRQRLVVSEDCLEVVNPFSSRTIAWDELRSVEPPDTYGGTLKTGLMLHLRDGTTVYANAYSRGPMDAGEDFAEDVLRAIRERLGEGD